MKYLRAANKLCDDTVGHVATCLVGPKYKPITCTSSQGTMCILIQYLHILVLLLHRLSATHRPSPYRVPAAQVSPIKRHPSFQSPQSFLPRLRKSTYHPLLRYILLDPGSRSLLGCKLLCIGMQSCFT